MIFSGFKLFHSRSWFCVFICDLSISALHFSTSSRICSVSSSMMDLSGSGTCTHTHTHARTQGSVSDADAHTHTLSHTRVRAHSLTHTQGSVSDAEAHTHTHTHSHACVRAHSHTHTHTQTHTVWHLWFTGTLHRCNGCYTVQTVCVIALHLNLALTGDFVHF